MDNKQQTNEKQQASMENIKKLLSLIGSDSFANCSSEITSGRRRLETILSAIKGAESAIRKHEAELADALASESTSDDAPQTATLSETAETSDVKEEKEQPETVEEKPRQEVVESDAPSVSEEPVKATRTAKKAKKDESAAEAEPETAKQPETVAEEASIAEQSPAPAVIENAARNDEAKSETDNAEAVKAEEKEPESKVVEKAEKQTAQSSEKPKKGDSHQAKSEKKQQTKNVAPVIDASLFVKQQKPIIEFKTIRKMSIEELNAINAKPRPKTREQRDGRDGNNVQRTFINNDRGDRPQRTPRNANGGDRPDRGDRGGDRPFGQRNGANLAFTARNASAAMLPPASAQNNSKATKKKVAEKAGFEDKKNMNKRALIKKGFIETAFFDEDRMGSRRKAVKKTKQQKLDERIVIEKAVVTSDIIPIKVLSEKLGITASEITKRLFKDGIIKTINETIDYDTAALMAMDLGIELELRMEKTAEETLDDLFADSTDDPATLVSRPPVVTVMGHVDHGKTSLLDAIRKTNVTSGEAGGITQHIGAYTVSMKGRPITFIDTPGHEAFTAMRARGAQVTDIVILVVAADDGVKPQTIEAINHAKSAGVSIIVAVNKMDVAGANPDRVMQQMTEHEILPEAWGGSTPFVQVSAKTKAGIEELLENVLLLADLLDLKANPNRKAKGAIIEANLDKGKGPVATVLVQNGTLVVGDTIISGMATGRIRAMFDDKGRTVKQALPSFAVSVLGFSEVPNAGDSIVALESEKLTKQILEERENKIKQQRAMEVNRVTLDNLFESIGEGETKTLNLIIRADVQGSVEAVKQALVKLTNDEVKVQVIHSSVGAITESDVMLASTSNAIIIGFNVRPETKAKVAAEQASIDIRLYRIIYDAIDDVSAALKGMLAPKFVENVLGQAEVREIYRISGVGTVAGAHVIHGKLARNAKLRLIRDNIVVYEGEVGSLKRFKDDAKEVAEGYDCGVSIDGYNDLKTGDVIEAFVIEEKKAD